MGQNSKSMGIYGPKHSSYTKENNFNIMSRLREQLCKFFSSEIILIGGCFNSTVGTQND